MRKERMAVPRPRSAFLLVQCAKCLNEQALFSMSTSEIKCKVCGENIAENRGGKVILKGTVMRRLD